MLNASRALAVARGSLLLAALALAGVIPALASKAEPPPAPPAGANPCRRPSCLPRSRGSRGSLPQADLCPAECFSCQRQRA